LLSASSRQFPFGRFSETADQGPQIADERRHPERGGSGLTEASYNVAEVRSVCGGETFLHP